MHLADELPLTAVANVGHFDTVDPDSLRRSIWLPQAGNIQFKYLANPEDLSPLFAPQKLTKLFAFECDDAFIFTFGCFIQTSDESRLIIAGSFD